MKIFRKKEVKRLPTKRYVMADLTPSRLTATFDILTHPHRRYVVAYLTDECEEIGINTLATAITKWEGDYTDPNRSTDSKPVEIGLRHTHLPKLAEAGIISFGRNNDSITLREAGGLDRFLEDRAHTDGYIQAGADD